MHFMYANANHCENTSEISIGILFQIVAPEYFTEFNPYLVVLTVGVLNSFLLEKVVL